MLSKHGEVKSTYEVHDKSYQTEHESFRLLNRMHLHKIKDHEEMKAELKLGGGSRRTIKDGCLQLGLARTRWVEIPHVPVSKSHS